MLQPVNETRIYCHQIIGTDRLLQPSRFHIVSYQSHTVTVKKVINSVLFLFWLFFSWLQLSQKMMMFKSQLNLEASFMIILLLDIKKGCLDCEIMNGSMWLFFTWMVAMVPISGVVSLWLVLYDQTSGWTTATDPGQQLLDSFPQKEQITMSPTNTAKYLTSYFTY